MIKPIDNNVPIKNLTLKAVSVTNIDFLINSNKNDVVDLILTEIIEKYKPRILEYLEGRDQEYWKNLKENNREDHLYTKLEIIFSDFDAKSFLKKNVPQDVPQKDFYGLNKIGEPKNDTTNR